MAVSGAPFHNKTHKTCAQSAETALAFLREKVPHGRANFCGSVPAIFASSIDGFLG
jgi:hypothetical protein